MTGGAGFIGSHTCVELLLAGHDVVMVDNFSNSKRSVVGMIEQLGKKTCVCYEADLLHYSDLERIFSEHHFDAIIHFAGLKAVGESVAFPLKYYENNVTGTLNLCRLMKQYQVNHMVFSSSATVYGMNNPSPLTEEMPLATTNPYGSTKRMIEQILTDLAAADTDFKVILLRYFNPIGAHESGLIGENPKGIPNNLMPYITQVAAGQLEQLQIFGNDYDTHDGTGVRDYIHVVDLAKGHLKALERIGYQEGTKVYNLGTGVGYSVLDVIGGFEKATGIKIPYTIVDRRSGDVGVCFADPTKAKMELGWNAEKDLESMCKDAWNFQRSSRG